jgi:uncharacterized membrane protein
MYLELRPMRWGIMLSLTAILFGFVLGGIFGAIEAPLQDQLRQSGELVLSSVYNGDKAALDKVLAKSWTYYKRAHMHAGAIGTATLLMAMLLGGLPGSETMKRFVSLGLGLGAIGYSSFWLAAGRMAPALGGTGAAKEALTWLAVPSAGLLLLGTVMTLCWAAWGLFRREV